MLLTPLMFFCSGFTAPPATYDGRAGKLSVSRRFSLLLPANPGTVLFAGYGSTLRDPSQLGRASLVRAEDGFFLKLSYLFQM